MSEPWDWRNQPADEEPLKPGNNKPGGPPLWAAAMLIAVGVLLFLGNLGLVPIHDIWVFWPAFVIAAGISQMVRPRNAQSNLWGIVSILFGAAFLLSNFSLLHFRVGGGYFSIAPLLIAFGVLALFKQRAGGNARSRRRKPHFAPKQPYASPFQQAGSGYQNALQDFVLFGSLKRKLETLAFAGGDLTSIFGSIEVDFRRAVIPALTTSVVVNTTAVFGSIKLRVPSNWRVHISGMSILGNFEDKTIPPNIGAAAPVLVVSGISLFSSVEIED